MELPHLVPSRASEDLCNGRLPWDDEQPTANRADEECSSGFSCSMAEAPSSSCGHHGPMYTLVKILDRDGHPMYEPLVRGPGPRWCSGS